MKRRVLFTMLALLSIAAYSQKLDNVNLSNYTGFENEFNFEDGDYYVNEIRLLSEKYELNAPQKDFQKYAIRVRDNKVYLFYRYNGKWIERKLEKFVDNYSDPKDNLYDWFNRLNSKTVMSYLKKDGLYYYLVSELAMGHNFYCMISEGKNPVVIFESQEDDYEGPMMLETYIYVFGKENVTPKVIEYNSKQTSSTNVSVNKIMTAKENLRLRKAEVTSSEIITTMKAGTKVKVVELGKAEVIDGISSNWVKVEVQSGAKDRNGNAIKAGTVGWCYGGYLK